MINPQEKPALCQRALNELTKSCLKADGQIGPATVEVIKRYQTQQGLPINGTLDDATFDKLAPFIQKRFLLQEDIVATAKNFGIVPSALFAIAEVEGNGQGFLPDGRPKILFERHKFYQYVKVRLSQAVADEWQKKYPNLCHPLRDRAAYAPTGAGEWDRFEKARMLDATCAILSTSWGLFQIMGFNYGLAGFADPQAMVVAIAASEKNHLTAVASFIKSQPNFFAAVKARNFDRMAFYYNGSAYADYGYDKKLAAADKKYIAFNNL